MTLRQLLSFAFLTLWANQSLAGAWLKGESRGELIVGAVYFSSAGFWDKDGRQSAQPRFEKLELNPYLEYGYSDELTLGANLFLHTLSQEGSASTNQTGNVGLGNSEFFTRHRLYQDESSVLTVQPLIALPSAYEQSDSPRSGSDSFDAEISLLGGHNFTWQDQSHYGEARIGYRYRSDSQLSDQLRIDAKAGLSVSERWSIIPAAYGIFSLAGSKNPIFTEDGQQDYDLIKLEAMLRYDVSERLYVQGGGFGHVYGRNVGDGSGLILSIGRHF